MSFLCLPGVGSLVSLGSTACLTVVSTLNLCCSLAACFSCKASYGASKALYVGIFLLSAVLGIFLRYWGEAALSRWATTLNVCTSGACWGQQADYRISGAVFAFFISMAALSAVYRPAHLGAWFVKLLYFLLLLGLTLVVPNDFWTGYAQFSRYGSVLFLIAQVLIIIDFAYALHEWLLARIDASDAALEAKGWEPGLCSSPAKLGYVALALGAAGGSVAGLGVMYKFFGTCALNQFFLSETLVLGVVLVLVSLANSIGKGLLPPVLLWAYNVFLVYGAITNNPDTACNALAAQENQNQASIIAGAVISVLSVTWAAYSSAGSAQSTLALNRSSRAVDAPGFPPPGSHGSANPVADVEGAAAGGAVAEWKAGSSGAAKGGEGGAAAYQGGVASSGSSGAGAAAATDAEYAQDERPTKADRRPWLFHVIMALGGLYLGMVLTNWGTPQASSEPNSNPELSVASMWVRIVSQWAVWLVYIWTLVAPLCCPQRDFS